ncbi:hypothetical protein AB6A40_001356 [Gnathostoma spinigerum]|uniref:G-protein coupled receptors family 1 profile domain-containing protein n=1 Tax=Gnathostoma spinigerum TaxID=75299 RepID=A0ABD6EDS1_9BILA
MSNSIPPTTAISEIKEPVGDGDAYLLILPAIVLFGLCGNLISIVTIMHSRLRQLSANQYLIALTSADSVFLVGLLLILFKVDFIAYEFCVVIEYVLMTSSYISSWSIAALTIERYIAIAHPLRQVMYGHIARWKIILIWVPLPFIFNLIQFVSLVPYDDVTDPNYPNIRRCTPSSGNLQVVAELADVVFCYLVPCLIVVILNLIVVGKVSSSNKDFTQKNNKHTRSHGDKSSSAGSARILLIVPVVYIILNTPFYLFRMTETIMLNVFDNKEWSIEGGIHSNSIILLNNAAHYLFYFNFSCDVIVYAFSSTRFRRTAIRAWRLILCPNSERHKPNDLTKRVRSSYTRRASATMPEGRLINSVDDVSTTRV